MGGSGPSGHSSLFVLRRLPVTTLKIDRTFIAGLGRDDQDVTVVSSVLALAEGMEPVGRGLVSRRPNSCSRSAGDNYTVVLEETNGSACTSGTGTVLTESDARSCMAAQVDLLAGRHWPVLVRLAGIRSMTPEARKVFANRAPRDSSSRVAMLAESPVQRVLANFYLGLIKRQPVPVRMFTDETAAREWLHRPERRLDRAP